LGGSAKLFYIGEPPFVVIDCLSPVKEEEKMAEYDLIIRNGTIVDGTGGIPAYRGDIAIKQGKIAMISGRIKATAIKEVDATVVSLPSAGPNNVRILMRIAGPR